MDHPHIGVVVHPPPTSAAPALRRASRVRVRRLELEHQHPPIHPCPRTHALNNFVVAASLSLMVATCESSPLAEMSAACPFIWQVQLERSLLLVHRSEPPRARDEICCCVPSAHPGRNR